MSATEPTFEFGLGLGASHHLNKLLGGAGCFNTTQIKMESVQKIIDDDKASEVAARVLELAQLEPPVVEIDEEYQRTHYRLGDDGFGAAYIQPSFITGPYDTPKLVGVPEDSDHLYANNRTDVVNRR